MPHRSPRPFGLPVPLSGPPNALPYTRPRGAGGLCAGLAAVAVGSLLSACQMAPMGPGLMDAQPAPVAAAPSPAASSPASSPAPAAAPAPATASPNGTAASPPAHTAAVPGLLDLLDRPAERALLAGLRAYDDSQYPEAEAQLRRAIDGNLRSLRDRGAARKMLAFIYCTTTRMAQCEAEFRAALRDDPSFALSRGEAGHPMWGPVYKRVKPQ
ncbi:MAG TPA: TssQ family T6SS-associated lipoprotein [Burkholderiaceae bacterium]|nr:TssQ family T6SS-associated lipoprotein [Burkholderiaceae bacterium]